MRLYTLHYIVEDDDNDDYDDIFGTETEDTRNNKKEMNIKLRLYYYSMKYKTYKTFCKTNKMKDFKLQ